MLRDFQENAKNNLMAGNSVIIIAPTGLGKTLAAILPFVENLPKNPWFRTDLFCP